MLSVGSVGLFVFGLSGFRFWFGGVSTDFQGFQWNSKDSEGSQGKGDRFGRFGFGFGSVGVPSFWWGRTAMGFVAHGAGTPVSSGERAARPILGCGTVLGLRRQAGFGSRPRGQCFASSCRSGPPCRLECASCRGAVGVVVHGAGVCGCSPLVLQLIEMP